MPILLSHTDNEFETEKNRQSSRHRSSGSEDCAPSLCRPPGTTGPFSFQSGVGLGLELLREEGCLVADIADVVAAVAVDVLLEHSEEEGSLLHP